MNIIVEPLPEVVDMLLPTISHCFAITQEIIYFYKIENDKYVYFSQLNVQGTQIAHASGPRLIVSGISGTRIFQENVQIYASDDPADCVFTSPSSSHFAITPNVLSFSTSVSTQKLSVQLPVQQLSVGPLFTLHGPFLRKQNASFSTFLTRNFAVSDRFVFMLGIGCRICEKIGEFGVGKAFNLHNNDNILFVELLKNDEFLCGCSGGKLVKINILELNKVEYEEFAQVQGQIAGILVQKDQVIVWNQENNVWRF
ncbi:hypothetical protein SS50377_20332 [Spironucleus salmonicida]|uniref:Uncharacterized protein n=1 Tax=Spironucleus salmonicida TaxID=348837 RepID=V6LFE0_9EUKA|nr:hypothetical protein SS50377_20332 [Spironucleus salmonicida]|eukprot:EST43013.1 Hypothetical protein SS50377_ee032 [Spironucleus salmonicida]